MLNDFYEGNAFLYTWPIQPVFPAVYTPPEEWPEFIQEQYEDHPDKARELLAEAGYPNGFKTKFYVYPSADDREACLVVAEYLKDVGIETEIVVPETASFIEILYGREYEHRIACWWGNNFTMDALDWAEGGQVASPYNFSNVVDDEAVAFSDYYQEEPDLVARDVALKEFNIRELGMTYNLVIPVPVSNTFWWPWLKNFSGERDLGWPDETAWGEIPKYIWVDQDLKFQLTGKED
jgi:peptide/nickel transport system substrate-binding protein